MKKALIILAQGFEETEAVVPVDLLKRAGCSVTIAGLDSTEVTGSHGIRVTADTTLGQVTEIPDVLILPGGPGADKLGSSKSVKDWIGRVHQAGKIVAAICAAPAVVLKGTDVLRGRKATCFPGLEKAIASEGTFAEDRVVVDGNLVTSRGVGTALEFGLELVKQVAGAAESERIRKSIVAR